MDNESNPNDEEKLKSLLETLRKNDEKCQRNSFGQSTKSRTGN